MPEIKKYKVIAKVGNDKFVKYSVNNLILFASFLDKNWPDWRYFNVFSWTRNDTGQKIASFTKNARPYNRFV
jgi:hypothetical protein